MSSPILKSFTFAPQPKASSDPLIIKRERMIARLEDQKKLLADPNYVRCVKRWERKEGGEKVLLERPLRTSKWWQPDQSGGYVMTVKVGSTRIEFKKGKAAVAVGTRCKVEPFSAIDLRKVLHPTAFRGPLHFDSVASYGLDVDIAIDSERDHRLPPRWRISPNGSSDPESATPVSSINSRRAATSASSPSFISPLGIDHAPSSFLRQ